MLLLLQNLLPTALTLSLGLFVFWARRGLADSSELVATFVVMGVSMGLCHLPETICPKRRPWQGPIAPFLTLLLLLLPALLFYGLGFRPAFLFLVLLGGLGAAASCRLIFSSRRLLGTIGLPALLCVLALCVGIPGLAWKDSTSTPIFHEGLGAGFFYLDTLFHAAVSNCLRLHGVTATGLDGLTPFGYHFGSHWLLGGYSGGLGVSGVFAYKIAYPILILPLYFKLLLSFCRSVAGLFYDEELITSRAAPLCLVLGHLGFLPPAVQESNLSSFHVISESYLISLAASFGFLWALCEARRAWLVEPRAKPLILCGAGLGIWGALISATKLSQGYLLAVGLAFLLVQAFRRLEKLFFVLGGICLAGLAFGGSIAASPHWQNRTPFSPFHFLTYVDAPWVPFFFFTYFAWHWLYLSLRVESLSAKTATGWRRFLAGPDAADFGCFLVVTLAAVLPAFTIGGNMGSSGAYFLEPTRAVAVALTLVLFSWRGRGAGSSEGGLAGLKIPGAIVFAWAFTLVVAASWLHVAYHGTKTVENELLLRSALSRGASRGERILKQVGDSPWLHELSGLASLPDETKRGILLYIPRTAVRYWENLGTNFYGLAASAFLAPALTGIPLLDGLPRTSHPYHGFSEILASPSFSQELPDRPNASLCEAALQRGFRRVIRLDPEGDGVRKSELACGEGNR